MHVFEGTLFIFYFDSGFALKVCSASKV